jgi:hypothetical protein
VRVLDALDPNPAYLLGPRWEYLAWNQAQERLYPGADRHQGRHRNLLWIVFTDPPARRLIAGWEDEAHRLLRQFRADTAAIRTDPQVVELIGSLRAASEEFAGWWADHDVSGFHSRLRRYHHPTAGELVFEYQQLTPPEWSQYRVVCQLGVAGDDSVARLASPEIFRQGN